MDPTMAHERKTALVHASWARQDKYCSRLVTPPSIVFSSDVTRQGALGGRCEQSTGEAELLID